MDKSILLCLALFTASTADAADNVAQWEGVYTRAGKTIKAGEWMGIGGGAGVAAGAAMLIGGGAGAVAGVGNLDADQAGSGAGMAVGGIVVAGVGYSIFAVGPAVTAGGSIRQSKAIRKLNPDAPFPWLGTTAWVLWGFGLPSTFANPAAAVLLHSGAYVTAGMQKGKNRMYWDARTKAAYNEMDRSNFTVSVTPMSTPEFKGMMLYGTF